MKTKKPDIFKYGNYGTFGKIWYHRTPRQATLATPLVVPPTLASYTQEGNFGVNQLAS
jgi:hypothetical protein